MDENPFEGPLKLLGNKHDVAAIVINDPAEYELPNMGLVDLQDAETGEVVTVDTSSESFRRRYAEKMQERKNERDRLIRKAQVDRVDIASNEEFVDPLIGFFQKRKRK